MLTAVNSFVKSLPHSHFSMEGRNSSYYHVVENQNQFFKFVIFGEITHRNLVRTINSPGFLVAPDPHRYRKPS